MSDQTTHSLGGPVESMQDKIGRLTDEWRELRDQLAACAAGAWEHDLSKAPIDVQLLVEEVEVDYDTGEEYLELGRRIKRSDGAWHMATDDADFKTASGIRRFAILNPHEKGSG